MLILTDSGTKSSQRKNENKGVNYYIDWENKKID